MLVDISGVSSIYKTNMYRRLSYGGIGFHVYSPLSGGTHHLVIDVHGAGEGSGNHAEQTGLHVVGPAYGCTVVFPESVRSSEWDLDCIDTYHTILGAVHHLQRRLCIDARATFFTGFSQGGDMTWWMWLNYPDSFGGFVAVSGGLNGLYGPNTAPFPAPPGRTAWPSAACQAKMTAPRPPMWCILGVDDQMATNLGETFDALEGTPGVSFTRHRGSLVRSRYPLVKALVDLFVGSHVYPTVDVGYQVDRGWWPRTFARGVVPIVSEDTEVYLDTSQPLALSLLRFWGVRSSWEQQEPENVTRRLR